MQTEEKRQGHLVRETKDATAQTNETFSATENQLHQLQIGQVIMQKGMARVGAHDQSARAHSLEQHVRLMKEEHTKLKEIIFMQNTRIQQLEVDQYKLNSGTNVGLQQELAARDLVLASHNTKLAEHGLRLDMMDCRNTDGVLLWKITDIRRRRRDVVSGKTQSIYSQPFYTSPNGYKMCARLYLNGDGMGQGTHLSLFFVIMRGEYDSLLQWPFTQKVTYFVFDQEGQRQISGTFPPDPKSSSFERPTCKMNIDSNILPFMPLETLDRGMNGSSRYVEDGCLYILLVVDNRSFCIPK